MSGEVVSGVQSGLWREDARTTSEMAAYLLTAHTGEAQSDG